MASKAATFLLWSHPLSFNVHKVRLALEEKKVPYKTRNVNILVGENLSESYLKVNPTSTVPALQVTEEKIITDSTDILIYLDGMGNPLGGDQVDRNRVSDWLRRVANWNDTLYTLANQSRSTALFFTDYKIKVAEKRAKESPALKPLLEKRVHVFEQLKQDFQLEGRVSEEAGKLASMLEDADAALKETSYLAGPEFSMADVVLMTVLARLEMVGKTDLISSRPALQEYWQRMKGRDSYKKVIGRYVGLGALPHVVPTLLNMKLRNALKRY